MAVTIKDTKYFFPPRPASGAGTFSDDIVGLQTVRGGGLTQGNFEFTTSVVEKVNRTFGIGEFSAPINLQDLGVDDIFQSVTIQQTQFRVYPNYDITQPLNFTLYGSFAKRLSVSITQIINYFPAGLDILYTNLDFLTDNTAVNILYDSINDETYFEINVDRISNPFAIDYTVTAGTLTNFTELEVSKYRNLSNTYLDYAVVVDGIEFKIVSFQPSQTYNSGYIAFYASGTPFGTTATTYSGDFQIRPNDYIADKVLSEDFDEVEKFLLNRLTQPPYTAVFQVPAQTQYGQFYPDYQQVTWPKDGVWNLDIRTPQFDDYLIQLQTIAETLDSFKTNLVSRFLTSGSLKEFDTLGRKVEKMFQIYGRSFDQLKQYVDGLAFMNSVNYNPSNDIPNELLFAMARTLGWSANFSPITTKDYLPSVFGNKNTPTYPGFSRSLTANEINYAYYRSLILNSAYVFKSKGTRRSVEFLLDLIGAPESLIEYNEHIYLADQKINMTNFYSQFAQISGGTYLNEVPAYDTGNTFKLKGVTYTAFTTQDTYEDVSVTELDYPVDAQGYPKAPPQTESLFFQKGAGWYEQTPSHRSPEEIFITGQGYSGQNTNIQTRLKPFTYGQDYLQVFRKFPYINDGFKLEKVVDNNKSWLSSDTKLRSNSQGDYNAYYYVDDERLVLNVKNVDLFLNPGQGLAYDIWNQSRLNNYPIPESGLSVNYPVPGGVDSTYVNPEPKKKTFFEFSQTFWQNMINTRNRQFITDGKTGGYPTLQSLWWKYIEQQQTIGVQNNQYTYQKLIEYVNGMGPYWMKLVEQMIPATTIWQSGTRFENSILHKQKFVYRRQRGCQVVPSLAKTCQIVSSLVTYNANDEHVTMSIFPWLNGNISATNFSGILYNALNNLLNANNQTISTCAGANSLTSTWYLDLKIGNTSLIHQSFYNGYGINDVPSNTIWKNALISYLPSIISYNLSYFLNGTQLTITNLSNQTLYLNQNLVLSVGVNINVTC